MSQIGQKKKEHPKTQKHRSPKHEVCHQSTAHNRPHFSLAPLTKLRGNERRQAVTIAQNNHCGQVKQTIHKRSCRKCRSTIMPHHNRVGKSQNNRAELRNSNGKPQTKRSRIVRRMIHQRLKSSILKDFITCKRPLLVGSATWNTNSR